VNKVHLGLVALATKSVLRALAIASPPVHVSL
jgi:hypothetical protein